MSQSNTQRKTVSESKSDLATPKVTDLIDEGYILTPARLTRTSQVKVEQKKDADIAPSKLGASSDEGDIVADEKSKLSLSDPVVSSVLRLNGKLRDPNAVYTLSVKMIQTLTANGGGVVSTSYRIGDPSIWLGIGTFNVLFQRYRVRGFSVHVSRATANTGAGTTPSNSAMAFDTSATSVTPGALTSVWTYQGAVAYSDGAGYGFGSGKLKTALACKVIPEAPWFDLVTPVKQRGCVTVWSEGNTASVASQYHYVSLLVDFCGLIL